MAGLQKITHSPLVYEGLRQIIVTLQYQITRQFGHQWLNTKDQELYVQNALWPPLERNVPLIG
jgi:hypothetical protein